MSNAVAVVLHLFAINVWVGGTLFCVVILDYAAARLEPVRQHALMHSVFRRFFSLVWFAMPVLLLSGSWMIYGMYSGLGRAPVYIVLMMAIGLLMMMIFIVTFFGPYRQYKKSVQDGEASASQAHLARIRLLGWINVVLGACVLVIIGGGHHLGGS